MRISKKETHLLLGAKSRFLYKHFMYMKVSIGFDIHVHTSLSASSQILKAPSQPVDAWKK